MSLLPLISKLSIDGRSFTTTISVLPSRRISTSRKKPVAYSARIASCDAAVVEPVADVDRQVVVDRAFGDALQALDRMSPTVNPRSRLGEQRQVRQAGRPAGRPQTSVALF